MGHGGEFRQNVVHWRREWKTTSFFIAMNSIKRQKDMTLKDELPRLVGAQHATGEEWRNNSRKNEGMESKQKEYPAVDVTGDGSKSDETIFHRNLECSMNQGKLEVVK